MSRGSVIAIALAGTAGCGDNLPEVVPAEAFCGEPVSPGALTPLEDHGFVAHAGGSPYGLLQLEPYSNTREAFEVSYANGFRAFEFDLILLADDEVVVAHDYREEMYGLAEGSFPELTRAEVEGAQWNGKYEVMFAEHLIDLMVRYPDIWVVLDTKLRRDVEIAAALVALAPGDDVRDRMVPHLASEEHVAALDAIYPFPERMIAVYRWSGSDDVQLERMDRLGIDNIMMWWDSRWSDGTQAKMDAAGRHVWVHTPADPAVIEDFRGRGVGVYSDGWIECTTD